MTAPRGERAMLVKHLLEVGSAITRLRRQAGLARPRSAWTGDRALRVAFLSAYPESHWGTVFRLSRWLPHLARLGCDARMYCLGTADGFAALGRGGLPEVYGYHRSAVADRTRDLPLAAEADVVVLHRGVLPFGPWQRPTFERFLARLNPRLVYDFYDSIWVQKRRIHESAGSGLAAWLNREDIVERILDLAAAVTVSNEHLAEFARRHHEDVRVLPMLIPASDYPVKEHREARPLTLGWIGSRGNLERIRGLAPMLRAAAKRVPIRVRIVSFEQVEIPGVEVQSLTHPWSFASEIEDLMAMDVGLLPMEDGDVDRGKSPMKLLQYGAAGLPIVASPVSIPPEFADGESLLIARTEEDWIEAIARLAGDAKLRASLGSAARRVVEESYSFDSHADSFYALLADVASRPLAEITRGR